MYTRYELPITIHQKGGTTHTQNDLKPGASGTNINILTTFLKPVLDDIVAWGHSCGLPFSSLKKLLFYLANTANHWLSFPTLPTGC